MDKASIKIGGRNGYIWVWPGLVLLLLAGCRSAPVAPLRSAALPLHNGAPQNEKAPAWSGYDQALADAIDTRWHQLMAERPIPEDSGRVVLEFTLLPDGTVQELAVLENTEGIVLASLCEKAVLDPAPYSRWPLRMATMFQGSRTFQIWFEFDIMGAGYVSYRGGNSDLLAGRSRKKPTLIVLLYHRTRRV